MSSEAFALVKTLMRTDYDSPRCLLSQVKDLSCSSVLHGQSSCEVHATGLSYTGEGQSSFTMCRLNLNFKILEF